MYFLDISQESLARELQNPDGTDDGTVVRAPLDDDDDDVIMTQEEIGQRFFLLFWQFLTLMLTCKENINGGRVWFKG